mmetsp:Transcript_54117/g.61933  ORF Transcript_54117/g.61933 Transcript_54117/m.61933 type:complete len:720 (+) Transcript_54117:477-2636(+)
MKRQMSHEDGDSTTEIKTSVPQVIAESEIHDEIAFKRQVNFAHGKMSQRARRQHGGHFSVDDTPSRNLNETSIFNVQPTKVEVKLFKSALDQNQEKRIRCEKLLEVIESSDFKHAKYSYGGQLLRDILQSQQVQTKRSFKAGEFRAQKISKEEREYVYGSFHAKFMRDQELEEIREQERREFEQTHGYTPYGDQAGRLLQTKTANKAKNDQLPEYMQSLKYISGASFDPKKRGQTVSTPDYTKIKKIFAQNSSPSLGTPKVAQLATSISDDPTKSGVVGLGRTLPDVVQSTQHTRKGSYPNENPSRVRTPNTVISGGFNSDMESHGIYSQRSSLDMGRSLKNVPVKSGKRRRKHHLKHHRESESSFKTPELTSRSSRNERLSNTGAAVSDESLKQSGSMPTLIAKHRSGRSIDESVGLESDSDSPYMVTKGTLSPTKMEERTWRSDFSLSVLASPKQLRSSVPRHSTGTSAQYVSHLDFLDRIGEECKNTIRGRRSLQSETLDNFKDFDKQLRKCMDQIDSTYSNNKKIGLYVKLQEYDPSLTNIQKTNPITTTPQRSNQQTPHTTTRHQKGQIGSQSARCLPTSKQATSNPSSLSSTSRNSNKSNVWLSGGGGGGKGSGDNGSFHVKFFKNVSNLMEKIEEDKKPDQRSRLDLVKEKVERRMLVKMKQKKKKAELERKAKSKESGTGGKETPVAGINVIPEVNETEGDQRGQSAGIPK